MKTARVVGLRQLLRGLVATKRRHAAGISRGIRKGVVFLFGESLKIVPIDMGILRASGYARHEGSGFDTVGEVGFTAAHAVFAHEELDKAHGEEYNIKYAAEIAAKKKYWYNGQWRTYHTRRPQEQAKFLERPVREKRGEIIDIVRAAARGR